MRIGMIVHRYGDGIAGGAETACRQLAHQLAGRGHPVTVLTSRATSYVDWADELPPGRRPDGPVVVERLSVARPRSPERFVALSDRVLGGRTGGSWSLQRAWLDAQGPVLPGLPGALARLEVDVVVCWTYLYWPTVVGVGELRRLGIPAVVAPTAHDEPTVHLAVVRDSFDLADAFAFLTPEEADLVAGLTAPGRPSAVVGLGLDPVPATAAERERARRLAGVGGSPFALCLGRLDPSKGTVELVRAAGAHRRRHPGSPTLVLAGDPAHRVDLPDGVVSLGVVDEGAKRGLLAEAACLVQPSPFESFSIVLLEAWAQGTPVVVRASCAVTAGQVGRSGGGLTFTDDAELMAAVEVLSDRTDLAGGLGRKGLAHLQRTYRPDVVAGAWEDLLRRVGPALPD